MTKDEILQAFRLVAMGRANHPLQEELAEKLAVLFARDVLPVVDMAIEPAKRGPGRPRKAD